jgi:ferredoxin
VASVDAAGRTGCGEALGGEDGSPGLGSGEARGPGHGGSLAAGQERDRYAPPLLPSRRERLPDMGYKVVVDFDLCESNAVCMGIAPEVFEVRDDDFLYVLQEHPSEELRPKVEEAVQRCPKQAISIEDE